MQNLRTPRISSSYARSLAPSRALARSLAACLLTLLFAASVAAQIRPAAQNPPRQPAQDEKQTQSPFDSTDGDEESESESKEVARPRVLDIATVMRRAHFIRVHSDSVFVSEQEVEDALRKRKEFQAWGMVITRNDSDADLIIEITRKSLTRRFTFSVIDPRTMEVVTSGKTRSVLFGKKISNKVAEKFANRIKVVRPYPPVAGSTP